MLLVGKGTWYLPGWVQRHMPRLGIEGEEYFAEIDSRGATPDRVEPDGGEQAKAKGEGQAEA